MRPNPPVASTVDAAVDALLTAFGTISGVTTIDGVGKAELPLGDVIMVAVPAVNGAAIRQTLKFGTRVGAGPTDEAYDIVCGLYSWTGDEDLGARRARCVVILGAVRAAISAAKNANGALGGVCDTARLGDTLTWMPVAGAEGVMYSVGFTVHVTASI